MLDDNKFIAMDKMKSISEHVENSEKREVELEEALNIAGVGVYNVKLCMLLSLFLIASIVEVLGHSYVLPAAKCDLDISDSQRGLIASLPYILIVLSSFPWGYLVDTRGRKQMLVISSFAVGVFSTLAAFMTNLPLFVVCKLLGNVCIACPSAAPYAFIGEILPQNHRDFALSLTNALQMSGAALVPLLAWGILPLNISVDFGSYNFRSWRLLSILYSSLFLISGLIMLFGPESPKFLLSQGRREEALNVLRTMYAKNKGKSPDDYPVKVLKLPEELKKSSSLMSSLKQQTWPLLKPPYLKWLLLNGFLLFGIFATLNGLFMWVPDVLNRVLSGAGEGMTACEVIRQKLNDTIEDTECIDTIDTSTFRINSISNISCALITFALSASVKIIGKKAILVGLYLILGSFCLSINFITKDIVFAVLMMSLQMTALGIGSVNAYAVDIFPTRLRGMAVGLSLMLGRSGSAIGTNVAGILINSSCELTFYGFGGLLLLCGLFSFLLPKSTR